MRQIALSIDDVSQVADARRQATEIARSIGLNETDRGRVAIGRDGPSFQNRGTEFSERDEAFFERTPVGHSTEMLDLLLQTRDALREAAFVRLQLRPVRAWYTNPSADPTALRRGRRPRPTFRVEHIISSLTTSVPSVTWSTFHEKVRLLMALEVKQ